MNFDMQTASDFQREHYREFVFTLLQGGKSANDCNVPLDRAGSDALRKVKPVFEVVKK